MIKTVNHIIRTKNYDDFQSGTHASFHKITPEWGLKFFNSKTRRNHNYKLQKKAYKLGIAPRIGRKFTTKDINGYEVYGYITECILETLGGEDPYDGYPEPYELAIYPEYIKLIKKLRENGFSTSDMHGGNVGWMADGRLVAIDFSYC